MSEILPVEIKSLVGSIATLANFFMAWLITFTANLLIGWSGGGAFTIYTVFAVFTALFVDRWLPETKGRTLRGNPSILQVKIVATVDKFIVYMAMKKYNKKVLKYKRREQIRWKVVKCLKQPNNIDCGYHICRYMMEIIKKGVVTIPDTFFEDSPKYYEKENINEVRNECLDFLEPVIQNEINQ